MKKGLTLIDFVIVIILFTAIGQLLTTTANISFLHKENEIINDIKSVVISYTNNNEIYCKENIDSSKEEVINFLNDEFLNIKTNCFFKSDKLIKIEVLGCYYINNYCFKNERYIYVE